ncbi:M23 family metallopeptidase [Bordetella bronchialis]|uniref:Peptidase M23 n=1 Tax=Bordetella bronchialis TaxID=463025 RepID=A0A193FEB1_9BORD|nr:M23 family metallopeptidase [Bordetella bronchialis]ANN65516.1 peptidase M23 [Bordetella bronchialis]ANN70546.1 peptidase M23 [Bordetella bronchialis]
MAASIRLLMFAVLAVAAWWAWPRLPDPWRAPWHMARLALQDPPASLPVPVRGVAPRQLADTWNAARSEGRRHQGVDIFAPRGTPVTSTTEGIVTRVGTNRLGGKVVWVLGPGRQMHYYAHLDGYADVRWGTHVMPGSVLGYVGNTGNAQGTPPHLHYGIYPAGGAINPYPLLAGPSARASAPPPPSDSD